MVRIAAIITLLLISHYSFAQQKDKMMDHSHMPIKIPAEVPSPKLSLSIKQDAMSGYNLHIDLANYAIKVPPEQMTMMQMMSVGELDPNGYLQGHAHLYINAEKRQRVYGSDIHLPASLFKNGINTISITLNNDGHMFWTAEDKKIIATITINTEREPFVVHHFSSFPVKN